eukprot:gb/GECG01004870.1/.p1 GENE.gb/GECG01004870.1/~~gb/GECG01004870.1/.p1  ORF type:complete len:502 (+),score=47.78 gb/GECG01004870.1/:1-1506(+)
MSTTSKSPPPPPPTSNTSSVPLREHPVQSSPDHHKPHVSAESGTAARQDQSHLPELPIPPLEQSVNKFLEAAKPLLSEKQCKSLEKTAQEFIGSDRRGSRSSPTDDDAAEKSEGQRLQEALLNWKERERARLRDELGRDKVEEFMPPHYLDRYWSEAYLGQRSSIAINTNPFFVLEDDSTPNRNSQVARATSLIISTLAFYRMWKTGELPADEWRDKALCMRQYDYMFGSARIPQEGRDTVISYTSPTHIVILARGQVYWFNVFSSDQSKCLTSEAIADNVRRILADASTISPDDAVSRSLGVMTSRDRDTWAKVRAEIESTDFATAQSLRVIDSSLFVVCLDNASPNNLTEASYNFLGGTSEISSESGTQVGTCLNRWYDKTLQLAICENGVAGVIFEHSRVDGHTVLRYSSDIITDSIMRFAQSIRGGLPTVLTGLNQGTIGMMLSLCGLLNIARFYGCDNGDCRFRSDSEADPMETPSYSFVSPTASGGFPVRLDKPD